MRAQTSADSSSTLLTLKSTYAWLLNSKGTKGKKKFIWRGEESDEENSNSTFFIPLHSSSRPDPSRPSLVFFHLAKRRRGEENVAMVEKPAGQIARPVRLSLRRQAGGRASRLGLWLVLNNL